MIITFATWRRQHVATQPCEITKAQEKSQPSESSVAPSPSGPGEIAAKDESTSRTVCVCVVHCDLNHFLWCGVLVFCVGVRRDVRVLNQASLCNAAQGGLSEDVIGLTNVGPACAES